MDEKEKQIRLKLKNDFEHYASKCLKIRTKEGKILNFEMNKAQKYIHSKIEQQLKETGKVRAIILKGRQMGCTTYVQGRFYWKVTHNFGVRAFILTHEEEATNNLFEMAKRYHENCPELVKPSTKTSNAKELIFDELDSGYKLGTAGNKSTGRSSTIQFLHSSECAFWKHAEEHAKGIFQTVPRGTNTEIFIESTANGKGNWFFEQWQLAESGESEYIAIFTPWFWQDEYSEPPPPDFERTFDEQELSALYHLTDAQLNWRRIKIRELSVNGADGEKRFQQEYPCTAVEAFTTSGDNGFIPPLLVAKAMKQERIYPVPKVGKLLIGADIARYGDDRTVIVKRQGRVVFDMQIYKGKELMEIAGILHNIITHEKPDKVFIDICGLGVGVYDRLIELGHKEVVIGVNSANSAIDSNHYANKRAEMWAEGKAWLEDEPCVLPDEPSIHADFCETRYKVDSKGRLLMESKADMRKRGVRSSDTADAILLTFAMPLSYYNHDKKKDSEKAKNIMSNLITRQNASRNTKYVV